VPTLKKIKTSLENAKKKGIYISLDDPWFLKLQFLNMYLEKILTSHREEIIEKWVHLLRAEVSERYKKRPEEELFVTVSAACDGDYAVLVNNDYSKIDEHIEWITKVRIEGGFSLSEVQNAYELYRTILTPVLVKELEGAKLLNALKRMNACLLYTIKKFSNYFQSIHEMEIRNHAKNLEREVEKRAGELAESESQYRILVEDINDGYFVVNRSGRIVFANQEFCNLYGYPLEEMIGKAITDLIAPRSLPTVQGFYQKRLAGKVSKDLYIYLRQHKNGSVLPTENKVKRILYQGEFAVAGICRDITERIETEKRIRESERLAHIGKLTTSLAHEIRNPLSSVKMNSQIILKNSALDGNDKRRMEIVVSEISRLEGILDEMLDFARPVKLKFEQVSISRVVDSCLEIMDTRIREKNITVTRRYEKRVPQTLVDQEKIEQTLINVLLNSIEVLPSQGGNIEIVTKQPGKNGNPLRIEINDDGPGINAGDLPFIFDPFFSNKKQGTGLGLSNVKKIIEAHGGSVDVMTIRPHGTRVCLTIPYKEMS
jgi:PAS domain S-box-containing protein